MNINYPVGDFFIRIKNAVMANKRELLVPKSKFVADVAKTMVELGFLESSTLENNKLKIELRYHKKRPLLEDIKLMSKPGLRVYRSVAQLSGHRGFSVLVVSTPLGVMGHRGAIKKNIGGEVLAEIW